MIEVKDLVKKYGEHTAVDHLSFRVEKGQIYGFLGPNGAGKSTTMNIITGYIASTEGQVIIDGHDIFEEPEAAKKCIGYLPEQPPLYLEMTVDEYLRFAAELKGIKKDSRIKMIEEVLDLTRIRDVRLRLIKNLSKGFRQRVGLAQAILGYPEVIILDEPTVGLDPKQIIEIRDLIKQLSRNHTVILSSHILSEVSAVCDFVLIISHGKLVASDTPDNLSKLMLGSNTLEMTVKGDMDKVRDILNNMVQIDSSELHQSNAEGCVAVTVKTSKSADIREMLFYALAEAKCPILMMKSTNMSLEDVFLELTHENPQPLPETKKKFSLRGRKKDTDSAEDSQADDRMGTIGEKAEQAVYGQAGEDEQYITVEKEDEPFNKAQSTVNKEESEDAGNF